MTIKPIPAIQKTTFGLTVCETAEPARTVSFGFSASDA
jgi:hypothetical protein